LLRLVRFLRLWLLQVRAWQLDLNDIGAELRRDLRCVGHHVERGLALLADSRAARVRPYHHGETMRLRFFSDLLELLIHLAPSRRAGINRKTDRSASQAERVVNAAGHGRKRVFL